jgi:hypothetical protein
MNEIIPIVLATINDDKKDKCDWCGRQKDADELIATCTHTAYVTLCIDCYRKAGNNVR